jgi:hypothetical protein
MSCCYRVPGTSTARGPSCPLLYLKINRVPAPRAPLAVITEYQHRGAHCRTCSGCSSTQPRLTFHLLVFYCRWERRELHRLRVHNKPARSHTIAFHVSGAPVFSICTPPALRPPSPHPVPRSTKRSWTCGDGGIGRPADSRDRSHCSDLILPLRASGG